MEIALSMGPRVPAREMDCGNFVPKVVRCQPSVLLRTARMDCLRKAGSKNLVETPANPVTLGPLFIWTIHGEQPHSEVFTKSQDDHSPKTSWVAVN